jgi:hypothetical protein
MDLSNRLYRWKRSHWPQRRLPHLLPLPAARPISSRFVRREFRGPSAG